MQRTDTKAGLFGIRVRALKMSEVLYERLKYLNCIA